ncbi:hypothetical protein CEXT_69601 [Caerostris extrusa]|uniref:Uncharacterized protein n=1 Tax=Caerostris extrusa TaxID=172846 RepID=A0AAV4TBA4_CAEEX|nr:hypothetical protein CEXT_69601 [Caerostris extrusa]
MQVGLQVEFCDATSEKNYRQSIRAWNPKDEEPQLKCTNHSFPFKQQHKKTSNRRGRGFPISPQHKNKIRKKNPFQSLSLKLQYFHIPTDEQDSLGKKIL